MVLVFGVMLGGDGSLTWAGLEISIHFITGFFAGIVGHSRESNFVLLKWPVSVIQPDLFSNTLDNASSVLPAICFLPPTLT